MNVLITGTNRGLGSWLSKQFPRCDRLTRETDRLSLKESYDLIIHSAATVSHCSWNNVKLSLFEDNVLLTRDMAKIPHKRFVYISSIDQTKNSPYGVTKRISEIIVKNLCKDYLILRPSSLIGNGMRKNSFQKIVNGEDIVLTPDTTMNYILYEDILDSIMKNYSGVKSLRSSENITLKEVAEIFEQEIGFGQIYYDAGNISTDINTNKTSKDNLLLYKKMINAKR